MPTWDDVRETGLALPGVQEETSYGTPALKVKGKLLVRLKEDAETLALWVDYEERHALLHEQPTVFFLTPHYENYPMVLVRLAEVDREELGGARDGGLAGPCPKACRRRVEGGRVSGARHLYVHLPFCAHRCGYCDFVTAVGRLDTHGGYVDALLRRARAGAAAARRRARDDLRRRRDADVHRAGRTRAAAGRVARGAGGHGRGESGDGDARARGASVTKPSQSCVDRRAELPDAATPRARAPRAAGRRPPVRARSS